MVELLLTLLVLLELTLFVMLVTELDVDFEESFTLEIKVSLLSPRSDFDSSIGPASIF